jgi:YfiH family protein
MPRVANTSPWHVSCLWRRALASALGTGRLWTTQWDSADRRARERVIERQAEHCEYLVFEHLRAVPGVVHGVFTRRGGFSGPPFDGLNLSITTGDNAEHVRLNRGVVESALGMPLVAARPVHGGAVAVLDADMTGGRIGPGAAGAGQIERLRERLRGVHADAMLTDVPGIALFWAYGDCAPVLLADPRHHVIGLAHAGWRGAAQAVVVGAVRAMQRRFGSRPEEILAGVGPAIGACCYEVNDAVRAAFAGEPLAAESACFVEQPADAGGGVSRVFLDVAATSERQLRLAGVRPEHIETSGYCTGCSPDLFYSNRRGPRHGGRFGVAIGLQPE